MQLIGDLTENQQGSFQMLSKFWCGPAAHPFTDTHVQAKDVAVKGHQGRAEIKVLTIKIHMHKGICGH